LIAPRTAARPALRVLRALAAGLLLALAGCTLVSQPEIPAFTATETIYILNERGWMNWIGVVGHAALVVPGPAEELVQFGFGDHNYMESEGAASLAPTLRIVTIGWFFPSRGTIQRKSLGPIASLPLAERREEVEKRSGMRTLELVVPLADALRLSRALEADYVACGGAVPGGPELTPVADRQYHLAFENCQSFVAEWLAVIGLDTDTFRVLPRWSFWFVI